VQAWQTVDVDANHYIPASRFVPMMMDTPAPFGFKIAGRGPLSRAGILQRLTQLAIPVYVMAVDVNAVERARRRRRRMEARALARRVSSGDRTAASADSVGSPAQLLGGVVSPRAGSSMPPPYESPLSAFTGTPSSVASPMASPLMSSSGRSPSMTVPRRLKRRKSRRRAGTMLKDKLSQLASMALPPQVRLNIALPLSWLTHSHTATACRRLHVLSCMSHQFPCD
jgi:hypothetical protein